MCQHTLADQDTAVVADGLCPLCLQSELDQFRTSERALSEAYVRLRAIIPGAFDTPYAPTVEQVWATTERALKTALTPHD